MLQTVGDYIMNSIKFYIIFIVLTFSKKSFSQGILQPVFTVECDKAADSLYRTFLLNGNTIHYLVFDIKKSTPIDQGCSRNGEGSVYLPGLSNLLPNDKITIANFIMTTYKLKKVILFENCSLVQLYYRALAHSKAEDSLLKKGVANFEWKN